MAPWTKKAIEDWEIQQSEREREHVVLIRASIALEHTNEVYFWQQNEESYLRVDMLNASYFTRPPKGNDLKIWKKMWGDLTLKANMATT